MWPVSSLLGNVLDLPLSDMQMTPTKEPFDESEKGE